MSDETPCPACGALESRSLVEEHRDAVGGRSYRLFLCGRCGVVFSEPREAVGPEWYEKAEPLRRDDFVAKPGQDWRFRRFLGAGIAPGRLLDVGCGDGGFLLLAQASGWTVSGFDYDARMAEAARGRGLRDVGSSEFFAFCRARPPGEFDAVTLFDVLEHSPEPRAFLRAVRSLLKPGGVVAVTLPNARRPLPWGRELWDYPPHHFTRWTPESLKGLLEREGFAVLDLHSPGPRAGTLAEHLFYYGVLGRLLPKIKRALFGKGAEGSVSELYARPGAAAPGGLLAPLRGALRDARRRERLVSALKRLLGVFLLPAAALMALYYRLQSGDRGEHLYLLARRGGQ